MMSVAIVGNAVSKALRPLPTTCDDMKYCFCVANCFDQIGKCPLGRGRDAQFANARQELEHEAADLALLIEVFAFETQPDQVGRDDGDRPDEVNAIAIRASLKS